MKRGKSINKSVATQHPPREHCTNNIIVPNNINILSYDNYDYLLHISSHTYHQEETTVTVHHGAIGRFESSASSRGSPKHHTSRHPDPKWSTHPTRSYVQCTSPSHTSSSSAWTCNAQPGFSERRLFNRHRHTRHHPRLHHERRR